MNKFDIEAYLDGSLNQEDRTSFEEEMHQNPVFAQQVAAQRKVTELLRKQMLREQVTSALTNKPTVEKPHRWAWAVVGALLVLLGYFLFLREEPSATPSAPPSSEWKTETPPIDSAQEKRTDAPFLEKDKAPDKPQSPIAEGKPTEFPLPAYPSPNVRGQGEENRAWKILLDKVWYAQLPPKATSFKAPFEEAVKSLSKRDFENAFVQLETLEATLADNDTLRLLKGYCLLEMGEGADALHYFDQLENKQHNWKAYLQWHRGLALLVSGEAKKAIPEFRKIAKMPNHPFQQQSQKALDVLE